MKIVERFGAAVGLLLGGFLLSQGEGPLGGLMLGLGVFILLFEQPKGSPVQLRPYWRKYLQREPNAPTQAPAQPVLSETPAEKKEVSKMEKLFEYDSLDGNQANLTKYLGSEAEVSIPAEIDGRSVVCISKGAFQNLTINDLRIPDSVMSVNSHAFEHCIIRNLHIAYNAMVASDSFFDCNIEAATVAKNDERFWTRSLPGTQLHFAEAPIIQEKGFSYYLRSDGTLDLLECTAPVSYEKHGTRS